MKQNWYQKTIEQAFEELNSSSDGLSEKEAQIRLRHYGPNALPEAQLDSSLKIFLRQFTSPLVYILVIVAIIVLVLGEYLDAAVIGFVVLFNAILGTVQEGKAQNTLAALKQFVSTQTLVKRGGQEFLVPDEELVPGDLVVLREGDKIPADGRLVKVVGSTVDEASLTGESTPVVKITESLPEPALNPADQLNMVFKGTSLVAGSAEMVVTQTGEHTQIGQLSLTIAKVDQEIPLQKNIRYLSRLIVAVVGVICVALLGIGLLRGLPVVEMVVITVSLAVSIIPEGLPVVITLILAQGMWRMSQRKALIKKLGAVEALGQTNLIAVDKTGTITRNELVVRKLVVKGKTFEVTGSGYEPTGEVLYQKQVISPGDFPELALAGKFTAFSDAELIYDRQKQAWLISGDPTEAAMLVLAEKLGFNQDDMKSRYPVVGELRFDYKRKYRGFAFKDGQNITLVIVGAPEVILGLSDKSESEIKNTVQKLSEEGLRVIAFAFAKLETSSLVDFEKLPALTYGGLFGLQDTMHREVPAAVADVQAAGIGTVMITGDFPETAKAIAKSAGIYKDGQIVLTGKELNNLSTQQLEQILPQATVFARVTPEDKMKIVKSYQAQGLIVAMTGDGVNDVPPVVAADLGIAMGKIGTDVTKESADIVLLDDNFSTIAAAVEEGRNIYLTIKRALLYLFSTSLGELLVIVGALVLSWPLPVTAVQILWLNFVTDGFITVAFAVEPKEGNLLRLPYRKPTKFIIDWLTVQRLVPMAIIMAVGTLAAFYFYKDGDMVKANTFAVTVLAAYQWFNAFNARSETRSAFKNLFSNRWLIAAVSFVVLAHVAVVHTDLGQKFLGTTMLTAKEWLAAVAIASSVLWYEEIAKFIKYVRNSYRKDH